MYTRLQVQAQTPFKQVGQGNRHGQDWEKTWTRQEKDREKTIPNKLRLSSKKGPKPQEKYHRDFPVNNQKFS